MSLSLKANVVISLLINSTVHPRRPVAKGAGGEATAGVFSNAIEVARRVEASGRAVGRVAVAEGTTVGGLSPGRGVLSAMGESAGEVHAWEAAAGQISAAGGATAGELRPTGLAGPSQPTLRLQHRSGVERSVGVLGKGEGLASDDRLAVAAKRCIGSDRKQEPGNV